jgi:hypothetical protein
MAKTQKTLRIAESMLVEHLEKGDKIVTQFARGSELADVDPFAVGNFRYVTKSMKIEQIDICEGQWRTHIHINRQYCYDIRSRVWIESN